MPTQHINPEGVSQPSGYTHVVASDARRIVFVSGQVAIDSQGQLVGEGVLEKQTEQVFENLKTCLAAGGATLADVVKLTTKVVSFKPEDRVTITMLRQRYLPADKPPTSTLVGVQALARPDLMVEIEAIALLA